MTGKSVLVLADLHGGHSAGLTPPEYQSGDMAEWQAKSWDWFRQEVEVNSPEGGYDLCIINGDSIDGHGIRSGGREELSACLLRQCKIAQAALTCLPVEEFIFVRGTPYHGGGGDAWEDVLADMMGARIVNHLYCDIGGVVFDIKHKVGTSQIPHGRYTAVARARLWAQLKAYRKVAPKVDILIRSHAHYYKFGGDSMDLDIVTPALQGPFTEYGEQQCDGLTDYGFITFTVDGGNYDWHPHILHVEVQDDIVRI